MKTASFSELKSAYAKLAEGTFLEHDRNSNFPSENTIKSATTEEQTQVIHMQTKGEVESTSTNDTECGAQLDKNKSFKTS